MVNKRLRELEAELYVELFFKLRRSKNKEKVWARIDQLYKQIEEAV